MASLQRKGATRPDEARDIPLGRLETFELGDTMVGRNTLEPGWRWSASIKPLAGTDDCEFHHQGYTLSGRAHVVTRDGAEIDLGPGEFFEIPPHHDAWVVGDEPWVSIDWGSSTSYALAPEGSGRRVTTNVLFTDVVDSTVRVREVGDARWRDLLEHHNLIIRRELNRFGGREVNTTGDGFLALFDSAERAAHAALAMIRGVSAELEIRAAVHTGEVELYGTDVRGLAVHVAARVLALARPGEVLVSWTTQDLLSGSGLDFDDRGTHELKGLPGRRHVYAIMRPTQRHVEHPRGRR
jgi:class 3 adenylate cyclase